jgi:hypothetical protein
LMRLKLPLRGLVAMIRTDCDKIYAVLGIKAHHTSRHARPTSLGLYIMYA